MSAKCDKIFPGVILINKTVDDGEKLFQDATDVVLQIRPTWMRESIVCQRLNDGFTNTIVACSRKNTENYSNDGDVLVVRVYGRGTDGFINRSQERLAMVALHKLCSVPQLFGTFMNGLVHSYVPGRSFDQRDLYDFDIQRLFIEELVRFHSINIQRIQKEFDCKDTFLEEPKLFEKMKNWIKLLPSKLKVQWTKEKLLTEVEIVERNTECCGSPVVFCHNDLLPNNVIYCREQHKVYIIDLEYCHPNFQAFDIATYFCEFAGMKEIDFTLYPSKDYQMKWLEMFADAFHKLNGMDKVSQIDVERLYVQVNKFSLVSHLYWAIWGLIQAERSSIGYNYLGFSQERIGEYERRKFEFLDLS